MLLPEEEPYTQVGMHVLLPYIDQYPPFTLVYTASTIETPKLAGFTLKKFLGDTPTEELTSTAITPRLPKLLLTQGNNYATMLVKLKQLIDYIKQVSVTQDFAT